MVPSVITKMHKRAVQLSLDSLCGVPIFNYHNSPICSEDEDIWTFLNHGLRMTFLCNKYLWSKKKYIVKWDWNLAVSAFEKLQVTQILIISDTTIDIMTLSIKGLVAKLSTNETQRNTAIILVQRHLAKRHSAYRACIWHSAWLAIQHNNPLHYA